MQAKSFARHITHGMVKHLAGGISVFNFVTRETQEEGDGILCEIDG